MSIETHRVKPVLLDLLRTLKMFRFAEFTFNECNATAQRQAMERKQIRYPHRQTKLLLPFIVHNNNDTDVDIVLLKPRQLNWGYGPVFPQRAYNVNLNTGNVGVYYEQKPTSIDLVHGNNNEVEIIGGDASFRGDAIHITNTNECCICMSGYNTGALLLPCQHTECCLECAKRVNQCPMCRERIDTRIECRRLCVN